MAESLAGKLLVASPDLLDTNFRRSVVLMCLHDENGAMGIILNRPLASAPLAEHVAAWASTVTAPAVVFLGGPVEQTTALGLARLASTPEGRWTPVAHGSGLIDIGRAPHELGCEVEAARVFAGYAGWGAGQLEGELEEKAWFVIDPAPSDLFSSRPETLWADVLRRQGGEFAIISRFPEDPTRN